jgi:hypothetical protein
MRSILRNRPLLGDALLGAFAGALGAQDLSPITARGYLHDLGKFRGWLEGEAGAKPRDLRRVTAVDLVNYRQNSCALSASRRPPSIASCKPSRSSSAGHSTRAS